MRRDLISYTFILGPEGKHTNVFSEIVLENESVVFLKPVDRAYFI